MITPFTRVLCARCLRANEFSVGLVGLQGERCGRHSTTVRTNNGALLTDVWASVKTSNTIHSTCSRLLFFFRAHKVIIDVSTPWLWRECPVNATALIAPFNKACTADFCWFYVVIKQKSICLLPRLFFPRFSMCEPSADQMVTIYFARGSLKASHYNRISHFSLALALKFSLALLYSLRLTSTCPKARRSEAIAQK